MPAGSFEQIGDYKLIQKIGHGGMGEIWLANKASFVGFSSCVVKRLHRDHARDPKARELFLNEARLAAQLDHPNIVKVTDVGEVDGQLFLVMDWVDGVNLNEYVGKLRRAGMPLPLDLDITCYIIGEVLTGLDYAHKRTIAGRDAGVVHFDITPNNILISSSGTVKLTDFGLSRVAAHNQNVSFIAGTPRYMSIEHHTATPRLASDIYGLGVVFHELLTNTRYHEGLEPKQIRESILNGAIQPLNRDDLPAWLVQLCTQMLAGDYTQRPTAGVALEIILRNVPGYRRAGIEIKRIYSDVFGPPRSGLTVFIDLVPDIGVSQGPVPPPPKPVEAPLELATAIVAPAVSDEPPLTEPTVVLEPAIAAPALVPAAVSTPVPAAPTPEPELVSTLPPVPALVMPLRSRRSNWWAGAAVGLGVALCVGLGVSLGTMARSDEATPEPANESASELAGPAAQATPAVEAPAIAESAPEPAPAPIEPANVEPAPATPEPVEPTPAPVEPANVVEPTQAPSKKPVEPAAVAKTPVKVVLYINGSNSGTVKIGSKEHPVQLVASTKLRPGSYPVKWRKSDADSWHSAGTIKVGDVAPNFYEFRLGEGTATRTEREAGKGK